MHCRKAQHPSIPLTQQVQSKEFKDALLTFIEMKSEHNTFGFYVGYLDMALMLLSFTRAGRDDDSDLYYHTFLLMLDLFARYSLKFLESKTVYMERKTWSLCLSCMPCLPMIPPASYMELARTQLGLHMKLTM